MKDAKLKKLLEYEVKILRWGDKLEDGLKYFGIQNPDFQPDIPAFNYELMNMVLDDLGVPKDSSATPRDPYNDTYYQFFINEDNNDYNDLLRDFKKILKEQTREDKRRIRK